MSKKNKQSVVKKEETPITKKPETPAKENAKKQKQEIAAEKAAVMAAIKELRDKEKATKVKRVLPSWKRMQEIVTANPELKNNMDATIRKAIATITDTAVVTLCIQYRKYKDEINGNPIAD